MRIVKKCLLLLLIVFCIEQVFAIDPFTLKGERIIIPPCYKERTWKWHDHKNHLFFKNEGGYNNVYTEASLKHYSFNKDNKVNCLPLNSKSRQIPAEIIPMRIGTITKEEKTIIPEEFSCEILV